MDYTTPVWCPNGTTLRSIAKEMFKAAPVDAKPPQYSLTEKEAFERAKNPEIIESVRTSGWSRAVILGTKHNPIVISLVLTLETFGEKPKYRLSMAEILGPTTMRPPADTLADAIAMVFFGDTAEATENPSKMKTKHYIGENWE